MRTYTLDRKWWMLKRHSFFFEFCCFFRCVYRFIIQDLKPIKLLYFIFLAAFLIVGQVKFHIYNIIMMPGYQDHTSMLRFPIIYIIIYFIALIPTVLMEKEGWRLKQWQVWVFPILIIAIDGAGQGFYEYKDWIDASGFNKQERSFLLMVCNYLFRSVGVLSILVIIHKFTSGSFGFYGLKRSSKYIRVYALVFLLLLPFLVLASNTQQFLDYYPIMPINHCEGAFHQNNAVLIGSFELCYANDFFCVESVYRGALVIGMARWLGPRTVFPMAIAYMSCHLGKPDLEMISSLFGGYILGVLAYRTHHLWGGIMDHLGIAMAIEALGIYHLLT